MFVQDCVLVVDQATFLVVVSDIRHWIVMFVLCMVCEDDDRVGIGIGIGERERERERERGCSPKAVTKVQMVVLKTQ